MQGSAEKFRSVKRILSADHYGWTTCNDYPAVRRAIPDSRRRHKANHDGHAPGCYCVRRTDTGSHIPHPGRRHPPNQDGRTAGGQDRSSHMGYGSAGSRGLHRACVHICNSCCGWHGYFLSPQYSKQGFDFGLRAFERLTSDSSRCSSVHHGTMFHMMFKC